MEQKKLILTSVLIGIIILTLIVVYVNKDEWFTQRISIRYGNCVENYTNGKLITDKCPEQLARPSYNSPRAPPNVDVQVNSIWSTNNNTTN